MVDAGVTFVGGCCGFGSSLKIKYQHYIFTWISFVYIYIYTHVYLFIFILCLALSEIMIIPLFACTCMRVFISRFLSSVSIILCHILLLLLLTFLQVCLVNKLPIQRKNM